MENCQHNTLLRHSNSNSVPLKHEVKLFDRLTVMGRDSKYINLLSTHILRQKKSIPVKLLIYRFCFFKWKLQRLNNFPNGQCQFFNFQNYIVRISKSLKITFRHHSVSKFWQLPSERDLSYRI